MKKIVYASLALTLAAFMPVTSKNTPKDVAYNWLTAFNHLDFESAQKLSTPDTKKLLISLQELSKTVPDSNKNNLEKVKTIIKYVKVNGDKAVATYTESDNPTKEQTLNLIKVGNNWLVQFSKEDLMAEVPDTAADQPSAQGTIPQDTTIIPADGNISDTNKH